MVRQKRSAVKRRGFALNYGTLSTASDLASRREPCTGACKHVWCTGYREGVTAGYALGDERARASLTLEAIVHEAAREVVDEVGRALRRALGIGVLTVRVRGVPFPIEFTDWTHDRLFVNLRTEAAR